MPTLRDEGTLIPNPDIRFRVPAKARTIKFFQDIGSCNRYHIGVEPGDVREFAGKRPSTGLRSGFSSWFYNRLPV